MIILADGQTSTVGGLGGDERAKAYDSVLVNQNSLPHLHSRIDDDSDECSKTNIVIWLGPIALALGGLAGLIHGLPLGTFRGALVCAASAVALATASFLLFGLSLNLI
jgi:hypothetical protein